MNFFQRHLQDLRKQGTYAATNSESDGEKQKFLRDNLLSRLATAARAKNFMVRVSSQKVHPETSGFSALASSLT